MTKYLIIILTVLITHSTFSQTKNNKQEIKKVLNSFMECLIKKDSIQFYKLFYSEPVTWVGVTQQKTYEEEIKKDSTELNHFKSNFKSFYRYFFTKEIEEKFYNIQIFENGYIATVIFDYSFWNNGKKTNWGKESWGMVKTNKQWKITSIIFSTEDEMVNNTI